MRRLLKCECFTAFISLCTHRPQSRLPWISPYQLGEERRSGESERARARRTSFADDTECYLHAFRLKPDSALATVGLRKLYEKQEQWDKLGRFLETLVQAAYDE